MLLVNVLDSNGIRMNKYKMTMNVFKFEMRRFLNITGLRTKCLISFKIERDHLKNGIQ